MLLQKNLRLARCINQTKFAKNNTIKFVRTCSFSYRNFLHVTIKRKTKLTDKSNIDAIKSRFGLFRCIFGLIAHSHHFGPQS